MNYSIKMLQHFHLHASDGEIGQVVECYFEDQHWTVRYLVVRTGSWLSLREVLLVPTVVQSIDRNTKAIHVSLTREQIKHSPDIDTQLPVSRQKELELATYYQWSRYPLGVWDSPLLPLGTEMPLPPPPTPDEQAAVPNVGGDVHLRNTNAITGYHIHARDGELGHVEDFIIDDANWVIQKLVVDTANWWYGKKVLVPPAAITAIDWQERQVAVNLTRAEIQQEPAFQPGAELFF